MAGTAALIVAGGPVGAATAPDPQIVRTLAPTGRLRAAINLGNGVLAQRDPSGKLGGVSFVLATALAQRLGVPLEPVVYDAAGRVTDDAAKGVWDIAFVARDPERAKSIVFTTAYVLIEGSYLVPKAGPYKAVADLDKPGVRIAVGRGAAYDLYLTRALKFAELVREPTSDAAIVAYLGGQDRLDAAAGVRQALLAGAKGRPDLTVLSPGYTRIDQAMALPTSHAAAQGFVEAFLDGMKASGAVRRALDETGQDGAVVAPLSTEPQP